MSNVPKMTFLPTPVPAAPQSLGTGTSLSIDEMAAILKEKLGASVVKSVEKSHKGTPFVVVSSDKIVEVLACLRDDAQLGCTSLEVISAVDYPARPAIAAAEGVEAQPARVGRIEVIYVVASYACKHEFMVKVWLDRDHPSVASVCELFRAANWYERECYDLVGVDFVGHPNMIRVLLPQDWVGHPLRKDYIFPEEYNGMKVPL